MKLICSCGFRTRAHWLVLVAVCTALPAAAIVRAEEILDDPPGAASPGQEKQAERQNSGGSPRPQPDAEVIEVLGVRLPENSSSTGPVSRITSVDLDLAGSVSIADAIQQLPATDFLGSMATQVNGGRGRRTLGLRGLGPTRTLILVNGRRFVSSSNGASDAVDLEGIPAALVESVSVLRDGASPAYGADAIAGVVDVRLRRSFDGLDFQLSAGGSGKGDAYQSGASVVWGRDFSRGNLTLAASLSGSEPLRFADRSFSRRPIVQAMTGADGVVQITRDVVTFPEGATQIVNRSDPSQRALVAFSPGPIEGSGFSSVTSRAQLDTLNEDLYLLGEAYRSALMGSFSYELGSRTEVFAELLYSRRDSKQRFTPVFLGTEGTSKNPFGFTFALAPTGGASAPQNSPFLPPGFVDFAFAASGAGPDSSGDSLGPLPITVVRSLNELGPRVFQNEVRSLRSIAGARGSLFSGARQLSWELFVNYGRSDDVESTENNVNLTRALASVQPALCQETPGCALGDFFGAEDLLDTPAALEFIRFKSTDRLRFHLLEIGMEIGTTLAQLPAGEARLVVGAEYRVEDAAIRIDPVVAAGDSVSLSRSDTRGRQLVRESFFEASIPLVADARLLHELSLSVAGRYTNTSSFGGRYSARYALAFAPLPSIRFRVGYGTSFRAPTISDLFRGSADSRAPVQDRCSGFPRIPDPLLLRRCAAVLPDGEFSNERLFQAGLGLPVRTNVAGNPDLREEASRTFSIGVQLAPSWLPSVSFSIDYYKVDVADPIQGQNAQQRLDDCLLRGIESECAAVARDRFGQIQLIDLPQTNLGRLSTHGLDFSLVYTDDLPYLGEVRLGVDGVYIFDFEQVGVGGVVKANGRLFGSSTGLPNFRGRAVLELEPREKLSLAVAARYIGEADIFERALAGLPFRHVDPVTYIDLAVTYRVSEQLQLGFSIQNLTDEDPPLVIGSNLTNTSDVYDLVGRRYSVMLRKTF